jgi:hypothetical protein
MALLVFSALSACSTADVDKLQKEFGGPPEGAPRRSENPPAYPAVHDLPPARSKALMDEDQQKRMEADLVATRSRLQGRQKQAIRDAQKPASGERPAAQAERPAAQTVKRGRRPTALSQDAQTGQPSPAAATPATAQPAANAPAWPAPPSPDGSGFRRNP